MNRLDNVIAYAVPVIATAKVRIFEIGKEAKDSSRISEVDKNTGTENREYAANNFGGTAESFIENAERYLIGRLHDRALIARPMKYRRSMRIIK